MKYIKIVLINILIIFLLLFLFEQAMNDNHIYEKINNSYWGNFYNKKYRNFDLDKNTYKVEPILVNVLPNNEENYQRFCGEERKFFNKDKYSKNGKPIYIIGCSYTYGHGLKKEETFSYQLSELLKRPVYNFSLCADDGISGIYKIKEYLDQNVDEPHPEYVIYVYMYDHVTRYLERRIVSDFYEQLFSVTPIEKIFLKTNIGRYLLFNLKKQSYLKGYPNSHNVDQFLKKILLNMNTKLNEFLPETKQIYLIYNEYIPDHHYPHKIKFVVDMMNSEIWDEINKETNVTVVRSSDLMGFYFDKNYKLKEEICDWHPNARVWAELTPKFIDKYINVKHSAIVQKK